MLIFDYNIICCMVLYLCKRLSLNVNVLCLENVITELSEQERSRGSYPYSFGNRILNFIARIFV